MTFKMKGKRILVTGGAGFIASHLVDALVEQGADVNVLDDLSNGKMENVNKKAKFTLGSVRDSEKINECLRGVELVFHLAADTGTKETSMGFNDPFAEMRTNAEGTVKVLKGVKDYDPSVRIVYASSAAVYGEPQYTPVDELHPKEPVSPYGISKLAGEKYLLAYMKSFQIKPVIARIFNTYGPRQSRYVIHDFIKKINADPTQLEVLGNPSNMRDYAYVSDTVNALQLLAEKGEVGQIYNIAGGNPITIENLAKLVLKQMDLEGKTKVNFTGVSWKGDISKMVANITKIKGLGFQPKVPLEAGVKKTIDWFKTKQNSA